MHGRWVKGFTLVELTVVVAVIGLVAALAVTNLAGVGGYSASVAADVSLKAVRDAICGTPSQPGYFADMSPVPGFSCASMTLSDLLAPTRYPANDHYDPLSGCGWRGPYLRGTGVGNLSVGHEGRFPAPDDRRYAGDTTFLQRHFYVDAVHSCYGTTSDLAIADAWQNPIVLQIPPASAFSGSTGDRKRFGYARLVSAGEDGILSTPLDRLAGRESDGGIAQRGDDVVLFLNRSDIYESEEP